MDDKLMKLLEEAKRKVSNMSQEELKQMLEEQKKSFVRSELSWPKAKYKMVDGVKVYDSYEDYCND